jgi:hypothetical protein
MDQDIQLMFSPNVPVHAQLTYFATIARYDRKIFRIVRSHPAVHAWLRRVGPMLMAGSDPWLDKARGLA